MQCNILLNWRVVAQQPVHGAPEYIHGLPRQTLLQILSIIKKYAYWSRAVYSVRFPIFVTSSGTCERRSVAMIYYANLLICVNMNACNAASIRSALFSFLLLNSNEYVIFISYSRSHSLFRRIKIQRPLCLYQIYIIVHFRMLFFTFFQANGLCFILAQF